MLFLLGEQSVRKVTDEKPFNCAVCKSEQNSFHIIEKNYFTLFFMRILPLETLADYIECSQCQHAFKNEDEGKNNPSYVPGLKLALAYLMLGYGVNDGKPIATGIFKMMTDGEYTEDEQRSNIATLDNGKDLYQSLKTLAYHLNTKGKMRIVEAAYLMTRSLSEIEYADRLRINLIGNSLGLSLEFTNEIITRIKPLH